MRIKRIKNFKKHLTTIIILVILITLGFVLDKFPKTEPVQSASTDNVSGWAWSENIGWISFNCTDRETEIPGFCITSNYGVDLDISTGYFSDPSYAWSENIGWINFVPAGPYPLGPPNDYSAKVDFATGNVTGWIRAEANNGGWDGWILMGRETGGWSNQVTMDLVTRGFSGWAWGSDVVGWISFSSRNCDADGDGFSDGTPTGCPPVETSIPPYGGEAPDVNFPPTAAYDSVTWDTSTDSRNPWLSWIFTDPEGLDQNSYQIQIDDGDFSIPANIEIDFTATDGTISTTYRSSGTTLDWSTTYNWRVKVKDSADNWSDWTNPLDNPTISIFTLPTHAFPDVSFIGSPYYPSAEENVSFTSDTDPYRSICYDADGGCLHLSKGGNDTYGWTFTLIKGTGTLNWDADDYPGGYTYLDYDNPVVSFSDSGQWDVTLEITDGSGETFNGEPYKGSDTRTINVREPLPQWKEIIPR